MRPHIGRCVLSDDLVRRWKVHSPSGRRRRAKRGSWAGRGWGGAGGAAVGVPARGGAVGRVGGTALGPGVGVVDLAPGEGAGAAGHGAGVVEQPQAAALAAVVEPA